MAKEKLSTLEENKRYGLVAGGNTTCGFCIILASRGAVYKNNDWTPHHKCDCGFFVGNKDEQFPGQEHFYELYKRGRLIVNNGKEKINYKSALWEEWEKQNRDLSGFKDRTIRFITDDATKFLKREIKRGHKYDAIIMDPPSYGRGPNNELFKFEDRINELVELSVSLLSDNPSFIIINTYTTGYSETVIKNVLKENLIKKGFKAEKIVMTILKKLESTT